MRWARYIWIRELRHREVRFEQNPRFVDWGPMYRVARPALARLTGRAATELDGYAAELQALHGSLAGEAGGLPSAGALMQAPLLYVLVRAERPTVAIETGISAGYSTRFILEAMARNGVGELHSIGLAEFQVRPQDTGSRGLLADRQVGWLVPEGLRGRWHCQLGRSEELLPALLAEHHGRVELFLHDSLHTEATMLWEYGQATPHLAPGGLLVSHDIHTTPAWFAFLRARSLLGDEELDHDLGAVRIGRRSGEERPEVPGPLSGTSPRPASG